jgi:hypothetical protein
MATINLENLFSIQANHDVNEFAIALNSVSGKWFNSLPENIKQKFLIDGKLVTTPILLMPSGQPYKNQRSVMKVSAQPDVNNAYSVWVWLNHESISTPKTFVSGLLGGITELGMKTTGQKPRGSSANGGKQTPELLAILKSRGIVPTNRSGTSYKVTNTPLMDAFIESIQVELHFLRGLKVSAYEPPSKDDNDNGHQMVRLFCVSGCDISELTHGIKVRRDELNTALVIKCPTHKNNLSTEIVTPKSTK